MRRSPKQPDTHARALFVLTTASTPLAGTEIAYCILSLTAKMFLGWFLLINVFFIDGQPVEETLAGHNEVR